MRTTVSLRADGGGHVSLPMHLSMTLRQHSVKVLRPAPGWIDEVI